MSTGKVRLVEPGTPLPPRNPDPETWCDERIGVEDLPTMAHDKHTIGYLCTRFPHPAEEVHVSEPDRPSPSHPDPRTIVWGGE